MANEKQLVIEVRDKIATLKSKNFNLVGGNSDYDVVFDFDDDWDNFPTKTAVFVFGKSKPVFNVFEGNVCEGVAIYDASMCLVGAFAGDIRTTTPALVDCVYRSITDEAGQTPEPPREDVYNQIMDLLNKYINSGMGAPAGGNAGQVLKKNSDADYDFSWQDDEKGGGNEGEGVAGENGATFIPYVSEEGIISWTNDKGLINPEPVDISGKNGLTPYVKDGNWWIGVTDTGVKAKGEDGYTPVRGKDYWTPEDIASMEGYIDKKMGDVNLALDEIIALQDFYTGATFDELHEYAISVAEGGSI